MHASWSTVYRIRMTAGVTLYNRIIKLLNKLLHHKMLYFDKILYAVFVSILVINGVVEENKEANELVRDCE